MKHEISVMGTVDLAGIVACLTRALRESGIPTPVVELRLCAQDAIYMSTSRGASCMKFTSQSLVTCIFAVMNYSGLTRASQVNPLKSAVTAAVRNAYPDEVRCDHTFVSVPAPEFSV